MKLRTEIITAITAILIILILWSMNQEEIPFIGEKRFALNAIYVDDENNSNFLMDFNYKPDQKHGNIYTDFGEDYFMLTMDGQKCRIEWIEGREIRDNTVTENSFVPKETTDMDGKKHNYFNMGTLFGSAYGKEGSFRIIARGNLDEECTRLVEQDKPVKIRFIAIEQLDNPAENLVPFRQVTNGKIMITNTTFIYELFVGKKY